MTVIRMTEKTRRKLEAQARRVDRINQKQAEAAPGGDGRDEAGKPVKALRRLLGRD